VAVRCQGPRYATVPLASSATTSTSFDEPTGLLTCI
jgi:hypothetical protein